MVVCNLLLQAECEGPHPHLLRRLLQHTDISTLEIHLNYMIPGYTLSLAIPSLYSV
jgi:hypothetical protein